MSKENQNQYSNAATPLLRIDRDQATTQLEVLGSQPSDACIRAILLKENLRYGPGTGCKADKLNYASLGGTR